MKLLSRGVAWFAALAAISIVIGVWSESVSWTLVTFLTGSLSYVLWSERQFKQWVKRPLRPVDAVNSYWRQTANHVARSIKSARNRARTLIEALQRVRTTSDHLPDAWVILQPQNRIEMFNQSAEGLLGITQRDVGNDLLKLIRHPSLAHLLIYRDFALVEIASPIDDAKRLEVRIVDLEQDRVLLLARDVTELNRLLTMRQDFIANVSHELRTPLTVVLGYVESMVGDDLDEATIRELSQRLVTPVDRMRIMVDDLLTLTKLESAGLPKDEDIHSLNGKSRLELVVDEARQLSSGQHEFKLEAEDELFVECVPNEIHSTFLNLVTNAIRYSPDGGVIAIRWFQNGSMARFEVEDQGIGVPPEFQSRLTERFYRIDMKGSRVRGGTGLGLAIVKHILRRHRSELQITSEVGKGSTFFFELPFTLAPSDRDATNR